MARKRSAYEAAGVSIEAGNRAVELMRQAVQSTYTPAVLAGIGSFGGVFDVSSLKGYRSPALVASTDGVGTKTKLAAAMRRYRSIGHDIVNHSVNDILVQGAEPLFFLDYIASDHLEPEMVAEVVTGIAEACRQAGCVLLGGETAEMPGVYAPGEFDLVGTIVGLVERGEMLPRRDLRAGDLLLGFPSSGPHTNGYSLIRRIFADTPLDREFEGIGPLGEALLAPHRSYLALVRRLREEISIKALAHITGGGFFDNIPRVLPAELDARIDAGAWEVPPLFRLIQQKGGVDAAEMYHVFNMGIGMVAVVSQEDARRALELEKELKVIGELVPGRRQVILVGIER